MKQKLVYPGLGNRIKDIRKRLWFTQTEFGEALGVSKNAVLHWEGELSVPTRANLQAIAQMARVTVDYLIHGNIPKSSQLPDWLDWNDLNPAQKEMIQIIIENPTEAQTMLHEAVVGYFRAIRKEEGRELVFGEIQPHIRGMADTTDKPPQKKG